MSSYLIYSTKDETHRRNDVAIGSDGTHMGNDEESSDDDRLCETDGIIRYDRETFTSQSDDFPESFPLLTAVCSSSGAAVSVSNSATSASVADGMESQHHDLEANSFIDEYSHHRYTNKSRRYYPRAKKQGSLASDSLESSCTNTSRVMEIYCILLAAILLFALGVLAGRYIWEYPTSTNNYPSLMISGTGDSGPMSVSPPQIPKITVGSYYYPWNGGDFHRGDGYVRKVLGQAPALGEYDDRDPNTISQHLEWSKQGNIGLWVTSWWGAYSREDNTTRTVILEHEKLKKGRPFEDHKVALFYETFGRIHKADRYSLHRIKPDMEFICEHYLNHPNYYTLDNGRPVLFVYLTRYLETLVRFESVISIMRKSVKDGCGKDIYIVGDQIFGPFEPGQVVSAEQKVTEEGKDKMYPSALTAFDLLDGVTNYDVYGSMAKYVGAFGGYVSEDSVTNYYLTEQRKWRKYVKEQKSCSFIPSVSPGYNDRAVRPEADHIPLARSLKREKGGGGDDQGSLFHVSIEHARTLVDPAASYLLLVNSFNEWHEDTQIEPVIGESSSTPYNMTFGIEYHGYGSLYLDIIRNGTKNVHIVV